MFSNGPLTDCKASFLPFLHAVRVRLIYRTRYLVLGGGAVYGLTYIGALMELCQYEKIIFESWLSTLKGVAGTSAGTLVGLMVAAGIDPWRMRDIVHSSQLSKVVDGLLDIGPMEVTKTGAVTSGLKVDEAIKDFVKIVTGSENTTLRQFFEKTKKKFTVCVTNAVTCMAEFWDYQNQPELEVWRALRCSASVPGLFPPHSVGNKTYFDGGVTCNLPCHLFPETETLSLFVHPIFTPPKETRLVTTILHSLMLYMSSAQLGPMRMSHNLAYRGIPCCISSADTGYMGAFAFNAPRQVLDDIIHDGCKSARAVIMRDVISAIMILVHVKLTASIRNQLKHQ